MYPKRDDAFGDDQPSDDWHINRTIRDDTPVKTTNRSMDEQQNWSFTRVLKDPWIVDIRPGNGSRANIPPTSRDD